MMLVPSSLSLSLALSLCCFAGVSLLSLLLLCLSAPADTSVQVCRHSIQPCRFCACVRAAVRSWRFSLPQRVDGWMDENLFQSLSVWLEPA
ncbi:hypothetical protein IWZ01DRAFT_211914 [Phyllosticta capitalensis]